MGMGSRGMSATMKFYIEERRAWVRTGTHTFIRDVDPDFARFQTDRSGALRRMLRIWQTGGKAGRSTARHYLGRIGICGAGPARPDLVNVLRRAANGARRSGESGRLARRRLADLLRGYLKSVQRKE